MDKSSVGEAVRLLSSPPMQEMLAILQDIGPARVTGECAEGRLGKIEGYNEALENLVLLAEPLTQMPDLEPHYAE